MQPRDRLIVAIDRSQRDEILRLADALHGAAGMIKIGLQAFVGNGPAIVRELVERGERVFLDLKFHDIPNTAMHAVEEAARLGASIVNVHAAGGAAMLRASADAVARFDAARRPKLLGVTVLTSLTTGDLQETGVDSSTETQVVRLAKLCESSGLDGVVASPMEITLIREALGREFIILTPGIRSAADEKGDQQRTLTASEAVRRGADYIVVGRPVTAASDVRAAALRIVEEMS